MEAKKKIQKIDNNDDRKMKSRNPLSRIYIKKNKQCNCLCCKFFNDFWKPKKTYQNTEIENIPPKLMKFKKNYFCNKNCTNCLKYIRKKNNNGMNTWRQVD